MANKDLVKRAFSVTANLPVQPKKAAATALEADAGTDASGPGPLAGRSAGERVQRSTEDPAAATASAPKTGPGSMLAFMTEQSEVHKEVLRLREKVSDFDDAEIARRIDPKRIVASKWANRDDAHFGTDAFKKLKEEIANANGNVQPIKVRPVRVPEAGGPAWEIVYGHRRHRACLELGIPVLALIQQDMDDAQLFVEMERENRERADLSAWEQGVMYMRALEQGLFPSAKQLAASIDRDMSNISRAMALAKLPPDVVRAFGSPLNLQFRWATQLKDAHQRDPEGLLRASRELAAREPVPAPAEVFSILTRESSSPAQGRAAGVEWKDADGQRTALLEADRKGRTKVSFDTPMDEAQRRKLIRLIDAFLGSKSSGLA